MTFIDKKNWWSTYVGHEKDSGS